MHSQAGSSKTVTITGGAERYADRGIIPRSMQPAGFLSLTLHLPLDAGEPRAGLR